MHWLWRAVDQHGVVLDEILQPRRDKKAARRLLVRLLKRQGWQPRRIVTDKLAFYGGAKREIAPTLEQRARKGLNNRAENSHFPLRKRERPMQGLRSARGLQRFLSVFSAVRNLVVPPARRRSALATRLHRLEAFSAWRQAVGLRRSLMKLRTSRGPSWLAASVNTTMVINLTSVAIVTIESRGATTRRRRRARALAGR